MSGPASLLFSPAAQKMAAQLGLRMGRPNLDEFAEILLTLARENPEILVVTSEVVDNVPQLAVVHPYLPTHWWLSFDSLLRAPVDTSTLLRGLLSFAVYAVLFGSFAWARFTSSDVTS